MENICIIVFFLYLAFLAIAKLYEVYKGKGYWFKFTCKAIVATVGFFCMLIWGVIDLYVIFWCITGNFT